MFARLVFVILAIVALTDCCAQDRQLRPEQLYEMAEHRHNASKFSEAIALLNECLRASPGYMEAYTLRAAAREQLNDLDGALVDYSIYLEQFPEHIDVLLGRAVVRYKLGFYEQAREDLLALLKLPEPTETNSLYFKKGASINDRQPVVTTTGGGHRSHVFNYLGLVEWKLNNLSRAITYFDSAIRLNRLDPDYFVNRGLVRQALNDENAIVDFEHALRLDPQHTLASHNRDAWLAQHGTSMSTEERLTKTIESDPTILYPYLERAQERYAKGNYRGALADYNTALSIDSTSANIWLGRGLAREKLNDLGGAFSDYTSAIDLAPAFAKGWLNRGNILFKMERFADAVDDYTVALIYLPDYGPAYYNRAIANHYLGRNDKACDDLERAMQYGIEVDPKLKKEVCSPEN